MSRTLMDRLYQIYKEEECRAAFMLRIRGEELPLSGREASMIWDAFERVEEEFAPKFGGM